MKPDNDYDYEECPEMNKFEVVCQTCNAVTKDVNIIPSVYYDAVLVVKCDQCGNEEKYYWEMQKVERDY